ncbi:MAG: DNA mismatch repair protein MutS [Lentisphaerae bacterium]|nr:DNA mismatch repair protein MutS [Lentisphaerota bacterium]
MTDASTPMMQQYRRIKAEIPDDVILFFRMGDFYEMFFEDAKAAAPLLDVALTRRQNVPMCGVPYHAVDLYLAKLIRAGRQVAICDQMEDPATARGIVRREITRVVTPGTVLEENILDARQANYLAAMYVAEDLFGLALIDLSTGQFVAEELGSADGLRDSLRRALPAECLVPEAQRDHPAIRAAVAASPGLHVVGGEDWTFDYDAARDALVRHFHVHSLEGFGCEGRRALVGAAGAALYHVREALRRHVAHIRGLTVRQGSEFLLLDEATCGNLDLVPLRGKESAPSLLGVLDVTRTAMGGRRLREWVLQPLAGLEPLRLRHDAVEVLTTHRAGLTALREALGNVRDLERLMARISAGSGNARDLQAVGQSLANLPAVRDLALGLESVRLRELGMAITPLPEVVALIGQAIADEPPVSVRDGGLIREGYRPELDDLRQAASQGRQWLAEYQTREQARTGIKTLKVRHNKVFGYYIEVSRGQLANVPADYARKQTLVNAERFVTPELKDYEGRIMGAQERSMALEYDLFLEVREAVVREAARVQASAQAVAELDAIGALADRALAFGYVRPAMTMADTLQIRGGRHPVVEQMPDAERFVPNDTLLDCRENQLMIITGPNMAGKSTYIRQVALLSVMAQLGSFVPAESATLALVDRVFTRVGASDDLARGRSTFLVEMQETANILHNATGRSLIVLDEIGRGTSTFDGISIAWAVAEFLHNESRVKAKTLFATHYHELTDLSRTLPGVKNYNILVREKDDHIVFLRKIVRGGADKSYGIQVARLAGMPDAVIARAKEILANLEEGELGEQGQPKLARRRARPAAPANQMDLFGTPAGG